MVLLDEKISSRLVSHGSHRAHNIFVSGHISVFASNTQSHDSTSQLGLFAASPYSFGQVPGLLTHSAAGCMQDTSWCMLFAAWRLYIVSLLAYSPPSFVCVARCLVVSSCGGRYTVRFRRCGRSLNRRGIGKRKRDPRTI
jgi:hypothetical protein